MFVTNPSVEVREARTVEERKRVYRFRYKLYVEEMRRLQQYADHDKKEICDPLDLSGHVLAAYSDGDQRKCEGMTFYIDNYSTFSQYSRRCFGQEPSDN